MDFHDAKIYLYLCLVTSVAVWQVPLVSSQCRQICTTSWMEWSKCNVSSSVRVRFSSACCPDSHNTTACIVFCNFTDSDRREEKPCDTGNTHAQHTVHYYNDSKRDQG